MDFLSPKISFDDINKFEASCGLFLLIGFVASYIYDNNNVIIPFWLKITIVVFGLAAIGRGLYKWRDRQKKLDVKLELEIEEKARDLAAASEKKEEEKIENNIKILIGTQNVEQNDNIRNNHPNEHSKENEKGKAGGNKRAEEYFLKKTR